MQLPGIVKVVESELSSAGIQRKLTAVVGRKYAFVYQLDDRYNVSCGIVTSVSMINVNVPDEKFLRVFVTGDAFGNIEHIDWKDGEWEAVLGGKCLIDSGRVRGGLTILG